MNDEIENQLKGILNQLDLVLSAAEGQARRVKLLQADIEAMLDPSEPEQQQLVEPDDKGFGVWWAIYPRKEKRKVAERTWKRLTKAQRDAAMADTKRRPWPESKQYIPHATTYLNQERWTDPLPEDETAAEEFML